MKKKLITQKTTISSVDQKLYTNILVNVKEQITNAQIKSIVSANKELLKLYWHIGKIICDLQSQYTWGSKVIGTLAADIQKEFPGIEGFSRANIFNMKKFYQEYAIVQQAVGQLEELPIFGIPWGHNVVLISKLKNHEQRLWYAQQTIVNGWSRTILEVQIESNLFNRQGKAISNFHAILPQPNSDLAHQALKDPYIFDFLTLHQQHQEKDLEKGLMDNVIKLLLEMGKGFALIGQQYHLEVDEQDYYIDLLFYHVKLRCYFIVELKTRKFDVKDLGQLSFYLSAVDDLLREKDDNPTLGLILCKTKRKITAEYALRNINRPIGIAEYQIKLLEELTQDLKQNLPTVQELELEFEKQDTLHTLKKSHQSIAKKRSRALVHKTSSSTKSKKTTSKKIIKK